MGATKDAFTHITWNPKTKRSHWSVWMWNLTVLPSVAAALAMSARMAKDFEKIKCGMTPNDWMNIYLVSPRSGGWEVGGTYPLSLRSPTPKPQQLILHV